MTPSDSLPERWARLQASMRPGGALYQVRALARALQSTEGDQRVVGARGWGLAMGHLASEVANALDDLDVFLRLGGVRPQAGAAFAVDRLVEGAHHFSCLCHGCVAGREPGPG